MMRRTGFAARETECVDTHAKDDGTMLAADKRGAIAEGWAAPVGDPPLILSARDEDRLSSLAVAMARRSPEVARLLLMEIERARLVPPDEVPANVVAMHSHVEYRDEASSAVRWVELVYPHEADIAKGRVSVFTLVGAGLLGVAAGRTILWPTQDGRERPLTVLRVSRERCFQEPA
jgi:regulator of nucleoside diphosphate kinase